MRIMLLASVIWIVLLSQACKVQESNVKPINVSNNIAPLATQEIGREEAVAIANKAALAVHSSLTDFNVVPCEQSIFWAIIYDGDGSEYLIDKTSGKIILVRRVPQGLPDRNDEEEGPPKRIEGIDERAAVTIAKDNFRMTYGEKADKNLQIIRCELAKAWRIAFDVKLTRRVGQDPVIPDSHAPTYIIDKKTSAVLYRELY